MATREQERLRRHGAASAARTGLALLALSLASACTTTLPVEGLAPAAPVTTVAPAGTPTTQESRSLAAYYSRIQDGLLAQGLLRRDGGGPDAPFSTRDLVANFERIALFEEHANIGGRIVARQTASRIHRWEEPVRLDLQFGASVPQEQRDTDTASVDRYAERLARVTGLSIRTTDVNPNFHVFIVNEPERRLLGPQIEAILPGISPAALDAVIEMPRSTFCLVFAWDPGDRGIYSKAVAVIRGEHPDLLRLSCIHEEIAQGLGLSNDSPAARPSVFNDDEEFALLTTHDELLLKMLYDRRIKPGMAPAEARAVAEIIAAELMGETPVTN